MAKKAEGPEPSGRGLAEYEKAHWGLESTGYLVVQNPHLPDELIQVGSLTELSVDPELGARGSKARDDACYDLVLDTKSVLAYDAHNGGRLYCVLSDTLQAYCRETFWSVAGAPTYNLSEVARAAGGKQAKRGGYPGVRVKVIGRCYNVVYRTTKASRSDKADYTHEFSEGAGGPLPYLTVDKNGGLWFAGGSYHYTEHGIIN